MIQGARSRGYYSATCIATANNSGNKENRAHFANHCKKCPITDAEKWYFMECTLDEDRKPTFKLSEPVTVVYKSDNIKLWRKRSLDILYGY
jgi:hypothetical protein